MKYIALVVLAACTVPPVTLEGKQCPCADGYVCDDLTNRCFATATDGGTADMTGPGTSCLGGGTSELYRYAGMFDWQHADASWSGEATTITQASNSVMDSYAYKTTAELTAANDVRVIATMKPVTPGSGSPSLGVVLRAQLSPQDKSRYSCNWIPKSGTLRLEVAQGGSATMLASAVVAGASQTAKVTMEARVVGSTLACCLREYPAARLLNVTDPGGLPASGYPGLQTDRMNATFESFVAVGAP